MSEPLRVLMAEDSEADAELVARELRGSGFDLTWERVDTEPAMRRALERGDWDLVLSDFGMPAFDGHAALTTLRERNTETPFIFVSGTIGEDVAVEAMRAGAQDYVMKSNLRRLVPAVRRTLAERQNRQERRATQARLQATEAQLQHLLAASTAVMYSGGSSPEGTLPLWVSENITALLGYTVAEALQPGWWYEAVHPDDRATAVGELARQCDSDVHSLEYRFRHKDGSWRWLHDQWRVRVGPSQRSLDLVGAWFDVTERHRLEDQFHQAQKMDAIGRLAGGIAHDFNNLLTVIIGHTEQLRDIIPEGDPNFEGIQAIGDAVEEAAALTRQLLTFSRQQVLEPKVMDLSAVVFKAKRMLARIIGEDIHLVTSLDPEIGPVRADPAQISQVLMNLVVNARDAMPDGGLLTVETTNAQVTREFATGQPGAAPGQYSVLTVTDTGIGMDERTRARVFEPFFTTKETGKGTGLGLATVYGVVKQSGGFIGVDSEPGRGSTFRIYLPWLEEEARTGETAPGVAARTSPGGNETILLVEDADPVRAIVARTLRSRGYRVLEAPNGEVALEIAAAHAGEIRLLVTDVVMTGIDGRRLAGLLTDRLPALRVLYISGYTNDAVVRHGVLESTMAYLQKPFTLDSLSRKVREVLDRPCAAHLAG